jgi:putative tricarboxylic transport membrane protein
MIPMGIITYYLTKDGYPIPPLVIGVILGSMADANLRRGLMVSQGSLSPLFTRPVCLILLLVIIYTFVTGTNSFKNFKAKRKARQSQETK